MAILECKHCGNAYIEGDTKPCCCDEFQACIDGLKAENEALKAQLAAARREGAEKASAYWYDCLSDFKQYPIVRVNGSPVEGMHAYPIYQGELDKTKIAAIDSALAEGEAVAE